MPWRDPNSIVRWFCIEKVIPRMLAAVVHGSNGLRAQQVGRPAPEPPGSVLMEIKACGICATGYKAIKGVW